MLTRDEILVALQDAITEDQEFELAEEGDDESPFYTFLGIQIFDIN